MEEVESEQKKTNAISGSMAKLIEEKQQATCFAWTSGSQIVKFAWTSCPHIFVILHDFLVHAFCDL